MSRRTILGIGTAGLLLTALAAPARGTPPADLTTAQAEALLTRVAPAGPAGSRLPSGSQSSPPLVNDEVGIAELDPSGLPESAVLISRVTATGPAREVTDPASQTNVRYLDRLGRPEVTPDGVLLTVGGDHPSILTQARFDIPLPVALHVEYALDGSVIPAAKVPGVSGELAVTYTLTSTDAQQTDLEYTDAAGAAQTSTRPVFPPFQGTLTVTLPRDVQLLDAGTAVTATDVNGRTVVRWMVSLYPPISAPIQSFTTTMRTDRAAVPGAEVVLTPVRTDGDPSDEFSAELLTGITTGNQTLFDGLAELDAGAAELAAGSGQLASGLGRLSSGAAEVAGGSAALAAGVDDLAEGATQLARASQGLAAGLGDLAGGADDVAAGSAALSGALDQAVAGADELARSTAALAAAASPSGNDPVAPLITAGEQIEAGLVQAAARVGGPDDPVLDPLKPLPPDGDEACPPGGTAPPDDDCVTIYQGVRVIRDSLVLLTKLADAIDARAAAAQQLLDELVADLSSIQDDVQSAADGAAALYADLCPPPPATPTLDEASCQRLADIAQAAQDALATGAGALPTLEELITAIEVLQKQSSVITAALTASLTSIQRLLDGVEALGIALGQGTATQPGLTAAMSALNDGLRQLSAGLSATQDQLAGALAEVARGNATLAAGLGTAATGADELSGGSSALAGGASAAASGAEDLATGAGGVASGAGSAAAGAAQLAGGAEGLAEGSQGAAAAGAQVAAGAQRLQADGTAPAAESVLDASTDPAEAEAWLAAADARAADALPYGAPEGAVGTVAYVFTLAPVTAPLSLWDRIRGMLGLA
jgi:putative membrane protein